MELLATKKNSALRSNFYFSFLYHLRYTSILFKFYNYDKNHYDEQINLRYF